MSPLKDQNGKAPRLARVFYHYKGEPINKAQDRVLGLAAPLPLRIYYFFPLFALSKGLNPFGLGWKGFFF